MPTFPGKIGFVEDSSQDMAAEITVDGASLEISTGSASIGTWPIAGVEIELGARGYVATLGGEQLVLAPHDRFGFETAVEEAQAAAAQKKSRRAARKAARAADKPKNTTPSTVDDAPEAGPTGEKRSVARALRKARRARVKQGPDQRDQIHVPGLEDPDKDALWATHRKGDRISWRERLNSSGGKRQVAVAAGALLLLGAVFVPALVSFVLLIPGAIAVVLAGLAFLDPAYTRLLPGSLSELRLMMIGVSFFATSLAVATFF